MGAAEASTALKHHQSISKASVKTTASLELVREMGGRHSDRLASTDADTASVEIHEQDIIVGDGTTLIKKSFRERAADFLTSRSKKQVQHKSIDILNSRGLASKTIDAFEDGGSSDPPPPPHKIFRNLVEWYNVTADGSLKPGAEPMLRRNKKAIQFRAIRVILLWIRNHWQDFHENPQLMAELTEFVDYLAEESFGDNQKLVHAIREQRLAWFTYQFIPMFPGIREVDSGERWCPEIDVELFAHDLTMLDHLFFRQMKPDVYFHILSRPGSVYGGGFNLILKTMLDYCGWFRMVACYVPSVIQKEETTKRKTMAIRLLIKIAKTCLDVGNFQGAFALTFGLKRPASLMWWSAWEAVPTKYQDIFRELCALLDYRDGYKNYWDAIQKAKIPVVPYLVPYFHDLLFIYQNTPPTEEEGDMFAKQINFERYYDMFSVAAELETFRLSSYHNHLKGDKESHCLLLQHIRHMSKQDDSSIGASMLFSSGQVPEDNPAMNSVAGNKAIKKIIHLLSGKADSESTAE
ncbi:Ras protein-specific guanine nucleotide-releasing factor [Kappamyces sp. JEL0680]|nr:Ras protein-specific guanine nucleotide-releasing factor [Kappamyces sp. JEL0680]